MAETGAVAPPEAARRGGVSKGIFAIVVIVVARVALCVGLALSPTLLPPKSPLPTLVVGTNTPFPPFESYDSNLNLIGFDVDLANAVALKLNYQIVWKDYQDFNALLEAVQFSGVDMAASSITSSGGVGAGRNGTMAFSEMYYLSNQGVLIKGGTAITCSSAGCTPDDLANHTVAAQSGTSSEFWIDDNLIATNKTPKSMVTTYPDVSAVLQALRSGTVQMVIIDLPIANNLASTSAGVLKVAGPIYTNEQYSFAFPKTTAGTALRDKVNSALDALKSGGQYQTIFNKWFSGT